MNRHDYDADGRTSHTNDMTLWDEIRCRMGHDTHATRPVIVDLGEPHGYADQPLIPERFARRFTMHVYDWRQYRHASRYCPGHDAVSETIDQLGIWEPAETILTLAALTGSPRRPREYVADFGAQIGWFSMLAASCDFMVMAYDADEENLATIEKSARGNGHDQYGEPGWYDRIVPLHQRVDAQSPTRPLTGECFRLVKIDLEGAERDAVRVLWPFIEAHQVDHLCIEVSPVFADYYPDLVGDLLALGYRCWQVPEKNRQQRPVLDDIEHDLIPWRLDTLPRDELRAWIAGQHQFNAWFALPEARFG